MAAPKPIDSESPVAMMLNRLTTWLKDLFHRERIETDIVELDANESVEVASPGSSKSAASAEFVAYDELLLERCRQFWEEGDWTRLMMVDRESLQHHPDRAKLALLIAAGHQQAGNPETTMRFARLAQDWGCSKRLLSELLISGVHNSLARATSIANMQSRALQHFEQSALLARLTGQLHKTAEVRMRNEMRRLRGPVNGDSSIMASDETIGMESAKQRSFKKNTVESSSNGSLQPSSKFGTDAGIDELISDIAPFFSGRQITYVDVGAFIGEVFLKLHEAVEVKIREAHLYEPNPSSYEMLVEKVRSAKLSSVHTYNIGISDRAARFDFSAAKSMTKLVRMPLDLSRMTNAFSADCVPLDSLTDCFTDRHIDFLKIDVEGHEMPVLRGGRNMLSEQRVDFIYMEAGLNKDGTQQTYLGEIDCYLQDLGYRIFRIYEQKNEWAQDSPLLRRCNVAYMSAKFAAANPYKATAEIFSLRQQISKLKNQKDED